jgi:hypothetical protein
MRYVKCVGIVRLILIFARNNFCGTSLDTGTRVKLLIQQ